MKKSEMWGWLILLILMVACAYGNQCKKEWQQSQKYGACAPQNYNVFNPDVADM